MIPQRVIGFVFSLLISLCAVSEAAALPQSTPDDPSPHSDAELVSDVASIQPGTPFTVALRMTMEEGWHSYWTNPGDSGQPTSIDWALPANFSADAIQWPYPHRIDAGPLTSYGYSDEVLLLTEITPPDDLAPGTSVTLDGAAEWLICADICLPAEADVSLTLPVRAESPTPNPTWRDAVAAAEADLPAPVPDWTVQAARSEGSYALILTPPSGWSGTMDGTHFFPDEKAVLDHAAPQPVSEDSDSYLIALQRSEYAAAPAERLTGVLVAPEGTTWDDGTRAMAVDVSVKDDVPAVATTASGSDGTSAALWWVLLSAFVGGLLLNLMPCVFPVLSVKILGFARQGGDDERTIRRHGLVFGAGVLVSFWILAGVLLALRAAGSEIGWGFQLQSPLFVALMTILFFGIGLNLLGIFDIGNQLMNWGGRLERSTGGAYSSSFWSGVLATIVATPCTAPFMGAALGVALTLSAAGSLLVFSALGAGMAAPYVALSMTPSLLQRLPKPGAWMETLKQVLAFPMFAAAVWLLWVFGQQTGPDGMAFLLLGLLLVGLAGWTLERWPALQISARTRVITRAVAVASLMGAIVVSMLGAQSAPADDAARAAAPDAEWQSFAPETVEQLRADGRPVFIDFTAAWCLTCQVNKRTTLSSEAVQEAARAKNVALIRADWTNRDPTITQALEAHGRSGVPVYVLYKGDGSDPELLPEILTEQIVLDALANLPDDESAASTPATANASATP